MDSAGSGSRTAYPRAAISHGFHRHCHAFQLLSGPPWTHSSSGAGESADAPSGSTSHDRSAVPSSAVAVTSVRRAGQRRGLGRCREEHRLLVGRRRVDADRGGEAVDAAAQRVHRRAVGGHRQVGVGAVVAGQPDDGPVELDAEHGRAAAVVGGDDQRGAVGGPAVAADPAVPARRDDLRLCAAVERQHHEVGVARSCGVVRVLRTQTTERPSGLNRAPL